MSFDFKLPSFQVETPGERRMYAYLYQTVQQLNWAMKHIQTAENSGNGYVPVKQVTATGAVSDSKSPLETFAEIKALIIKSADIVNAYYDAIHAKLEGLYVAQSEFGEYVEKTDLELEANAKGITQNYSNIQGVSTNLGSLSDRVSGVQTELGSVQGDVSGVKSDVTGVKGNLETIRQNVNDVQAVIAETNAYIKTGAIDTDEYGIPVYGLEIGQTNEVNGKETFNKYARFSSSRLSFYDQNDTEVAYISDYKLYITNVHITGTLTIGEYEIDTSDGLAFRWLGGES